MSQDLGKMFTEIRRLYFPRWDRENRWQVKRGAPQELESVHGFCDTESRIIWVNVWGEVPELLLIHEICHAVAEAAHAKKWCRRMRKAAETAHALGNVTLAAALEDEASAYESDTASLRITAALVYEGARDAILLTKKDLSVEDVIRHLSYEWGMDAEGIRKKAKRIDKVIAEALEERQERAKFLQEYEKQQRKGE